MLRYNLAPAPLICHALTPLALTRTAEMFGEGWDFDDSRQFSYHAWSSFAGRRWLSKINPDKIFQVETSFNLLLQRWTSEELREDWRKAKVKGLV